MEVACPTKSPRVYEAASGIKDDYLPGESVYDGVFEETFRTTDML